MTELKQHIINYWLQYYSKTKWPFVRRLQIAKSMDENIDNALRELRDENKIILRCGISDVLVVYVGDEKILSEIKNLLNS